MDIPHELRDEFPQEISLIERMIRTSYEFRRLAERYDEVNRNIYRIESGEEPTTDEVLARLKKWRSSRMRLQRSSRSWSIECRIPGNLCDLSKGYFATHF